MRIAIVCLCTCYFFIFNFITTHSAYGQTANDQIQAYSGTFSYGSNTSGRTGTWTDVDMANIAAGNPALNLPGAGVKSFRTALPESFLAQWGYGIRVSEFQHYASLGMAEHTVFVEGPSAGVQSSTQYCTGNQSKLFANLYEPIWDAGNGTPYNENNYFAAYMYQIVDTYKEYVRFWEVWNEPDFSSSSNAWEGPGVPGNWWDNDPDPCDLDNMQAPVQHYVRLLRIAYEIVHTVDPDAYVAVGGLGFPSFLDAVLRNTDNPGATDGGTGAAGSVTADYPLTGGAYFDVMSSHGYPQFSGVVRNGGRHSDGAAQGDVDKMDDMEDVLVSRGYDGVTYPSKIHIMTETNIGRQAFGNDIGGNEVQRNYAIKTMVLTQKNGMRQLYFFSLDDRTTAANANGTFDLMGLFQDFNSTPTAYTHVANDNAWANATSSTLLFGTVYDETETQRMAMPAAVEGGAFRKPDGSFVYVLWAKTTVDQSEVANANYSFPAQMGISQLNQFAWDFSQSGVETVVPSVNIGLTGAPIFMTDNNPLSIIESSVQATLTPAQQVNLSWKISESVASFDILHSSDGRDFISKAFLQASDEQFDYTWLDRFPNEGRNYYQLVSYGLDGTRTASNIVEINVKSKLKVNAYPNPVSRRQMLSVDMYPLSGDVADWQLLDMNGRLIQNGNAAIRQQLQIEAPSHAGVYFLNLIVGKQKFVKKIVVI